MNISTLGPDYHSVLATNSRAFLTPLSQLPFAGVELHCPWILSWILPGLEALWGVTGLCFGRPFLTLPLVQAGWISAVIIGVSSKSLLLFLVQIQLDPLSAVTLQHLLQSQTITLMLLAINVRDCISIISSQAKYQKVHRTAVAQPQGHITPITKSKEDESAQLSSGLCLQWNSFHCLAFFSPSSCRPAFKRTICGTEMIQFLKPTFCASERTHIQVIRTRPFTGWHRGL